MPRKPYWHKKARAVGVSMSDGELEAILAHVVFPTNQFNKFA